jgi:translation initiation factor 4E
MWEDEANKNGGRWQLRVSKGFANKLWEDLILAFIGEQFECENEITGIVISIRPNADTISIWNRNSRDSIVVERIRQDLIKFMALPNEIKMEYEVFHKDEPTESYKPK